MTDQISRDLALPEDDLVIPASAELEEPIEGEIVEEVPAAPKVYVLRPVTQVFQSITIVVQHPHAKAAARHAGYVPAGAVVAYRRWQRKRSLSLEMGHQAKAQGDHQNALLWAKQAEDERHRRHERWQRRVDTAVALLKVSHWILLALAVFLLLIGIALAGVRHNPADVGSPFEALAHAVADLYAAVMVLWLPVTLASPFIGVLALYGTGRRGGDLAPGWTLAGREAEEERGLVVTADGIVVALQHTPGSELKKAFNDGWLPAFRVPPIRDGEGYSAVFSVPMGVTAGQIADQVEVFARNLHRAKTEVWVTDAERAKIAPAGFVSIWVANPGVLDRPAPEYPLLHDGQADVFEGVPGGVVARGDEALVPVVAKNVVVGGQMGEGKSNALRVYALGCATDPLCVIYVFVFANNGDFDAFAPRLAAYFKGIEDDTVSAAVSHLQELYEEVGRREGRLAELGAKKLTRRIAEAYPDMRPVVSLFSECHELFGHPEYGDLAGDLATKIAKRARKTGITLVFDTQSSRKEAIPPKLVELMSVNACFYVKKWQSNDGFLGDGSFQAGIRATELRPGRDRGRSVITGISDAQFELLKWYFVEVNDDTGYDAAAEVIARCMRTVAPGTPVAGSLPQVKAAPRDLLNDLAEVIEGTERVKVSDLPQRLRRLAPVWPGYRSLTGKQLRTLLTGLGVKTTNTDNIPELDPAELERARTARELDE